MQDKMRVWRHKSESLSSPGKKTPDHALFLLSLVYLEVNSIIYSMSKVILIEIPQSAQIFPLKDVERIVDIYSQMLEQETNMCVWSGMFFSHELEGEVRNREKTLLVIMVTPKQILVV